MNNIIITGMGVLSPAGFTLEEYWSTLYNGKATYGTITEFKDNPSYRIKIGSKLKSQDWQINIPPEYNKKYGKAACYCLSTVKRALVDAALNLTGIDKKRISVIIGTTMGEIEVEEEITRLKCQNKNDDTLYEKYPTSRIVDAVAELTGAQGYLFAVPAACAAGNYAVDLSKKLLEWNCADIVIAGGVDVFSYVAFAGFQRLLSLAPEMCQPFDKHRKGLVVGEGCGIVILEREGERRKQKKYGRVLGSAVASNAYHMTAPHVEGLGEFSVMKGAIKDAELVPSDIDYISAHGTGTKLNDAAETKAIRKMFDKNMPRISSIKSVLGHSMGAASILELIASLLMMQKSIYLPNVNYQTKDEECDLNIIEGEPVKGALSFVISNSFAFGGQTSCLVLGR
jgi:3-oxoacyl-[acyl-carrier-protein] synthase II